MFGTPFYHELTRKYVAIFGSLFNEIVINRTDGSNNAIQQFKVPIEYGPREKYMAIVEAKPNKKIQQIQLPRMSFEITGIDRDVNRVFSKTRQHQVEDVSFFEPVPYTFNFQLNIMTKGTIDALRIVEQILPYFNPDWTVTAQLIDGSERLWDLPIVLTGQSHQDAYEGDMITKRMVIWSLDFQLKGWLHGPTRDKKVIKFITVNTYGTTNVGTDPLELVTIQPGLTANGEPTTNAALSIDYLLINKDDNWDYIIETHDYEPD